MFYVVRPFKNVCGSGGTQLTEIELVSFRWISVCIDWWG